MYRECQGLPFCHYANLFASKWKLSLRAACVFLWNMYRNIENFASWFISWWLDVCIELISCRCCQCSNYIKIHKWRPQRRNKNIDGYWNADGNYFNGIKSLINKQEAESKVFSFVLLDGALDYSDVFNFGADFWRADETFTHICEEI